MNKVMDDDFRKFLKRGGRSESAIKRVFKYISEFEDYLTQHKGKELDEADTGDLDAFVNWVEQKPKTSAKGQLWGIAYYYEYTSKEELRHWASILRGQRIQRKPFPLKDFRGIQTEDVEKLAAVGIKNVKQMLEAGKTEQDRASLVNQTGLSGDLILELVKLSDLARIPGIKGIRARLYHDAGVDTLEKMAGCEEKDLLEATAEFVERTKFDGIAPLPAEVRYSIAQARSLPKIVEY